MRFPGGSISGLRSALGVAATLLLALPVLALTSPRLLPRGQEEIAEILATGPHAGDCVTCHSQHGEGVGAPYPHALIGPDDNSLCDGCHLVPWVGGSYPGTWIYHGSAHGSSTENIWPGPDPPVRTEPDAAGKCLNCHDPHGWQDGEGTIPQLVLAREEQLCLTCHDGSPAQTDIRSDLQKPYRHPTRDYAGRHAGPQESMPSDFAVSPVDRRHAECEDCHNPHVARGAAPGDGGVLLGRRLGIEAAPPPASKLLLGVSRVTVLNGAAGSPPTFTFVPGSDTLSATGAEYELCFKCHSSWTVQPYGQTDLARVLNPNNPSYHPIEAPGTNPGVDPQAFTAGWTGASLVTCGDCHGSDLGENGPHGSNYRYLLKQPYTASPMPRMMSSDELCFGCHSYDVYANPASSDVVRAASRFNRPGTEKGHVEHVGEEQVACYACHVTHGSTTLPHLLDTSRSLGLRSYTESPSGGSCTGTCHGAQSYFSNYGR